MMKYKQKLHTNKKQTRRIKPLWVVIGVVLAAGAILPALELTNTTYLFHKKNLVTAPVTSDRTNNDNTKGEPAPEGPSDYNAGNANKDSEEQPNDDTPLKAPTGNFVSNHRPNLDGDPAPNEIQSVCVTTPGATCVIVFTKGSVTKQLPPQQTDLGGAAYWTWKLKDIGVTEGTWKVEAKVTRGSQSQTATDPIMLEVGK
jgi:hypothetical protein